MHDISTLSDFQQETLVVFRIQTNDRLNYEHKPQTASGIVDINKSK